MYIMCIIPFKVRKGCWKKELMAAAYAKSKAPNKVDTNAMEHYEYADATVVENLKESDEPFIIHKCKR